MMIKLTQLPVHIWLQTAKKLFLRNCKTPLRWACLPSLSLSYSSLTLSEIKDSKTLICKTQMYFLSREAVSKGRWCCIPVMIVMVGVKRVGGWKTLILNQDKSVRVWLTPGERKIFQQYIYISRALPERLLLLAQEIEKGGDHKFAFVCVRAERRLIDAWG